MAHFTMIFVLFFTGFVAEAKKLSDYQPFEYQVLFTNPECDLYRYETPITSVSGKTLVAKPRNAFCSQADSVRSAARPTSPQYKLLEWIRDDQTTEIFFTYLSFSNAVVGKELCEAVQKRGLKLTFILDSGTDVSTAKRLQSCRSPSGVQPTFYLRGNSGGLGLAHNKFFIVKGKNPDVVKIAFSSGNMSSGTVLHHENWHFITTSPKSFFAGVHECVRDGMIQAKTKADFGQFLNSCRSKLGVPMEDDIQPFFSPTDGLPAVNVLVDTLLDSNRVYGAVHRFSLRPLIEALSRKAKEARADVRLMTDDDVYWAGKGEIVGANTRDEYHHVMSVMKAGVQVHYVETNHWEQLLHHNKYFIFLNENRGGVFAGAGNFTGAGFKENYENFYFIQIPEVVKAFLNQYGVMWEKISTSPADMPVENIKPMMGLRSSRR